MSLKKIEKNSKQIIGKTVFLRVDFNVAMSGQKIKEDFKIHQSLETINFLLNKKCKIVLASHLGQPKEGFELKYSLSPVAKHLSKILGRKVVFFDYRKFTDFKDIRKKIDSKSDVFLLDNLRFYNGEDRDCKKLAKSLASLADIYVNDAFAVSHRANSSVSAIRENIPSFMGFLLEKEILNLNKMFKPKKPSVLVMGGAKISTKIPIIEKLYPHSSFILLGGALANNFYLAKGFNIGKSLVDVDGNVLVKKFLKSKKIILPVDFIVRTNLTGGKNRISIKEIPDISNDDCILDIGPKSISLFSGYIKQAKTIIWNGPMGMFEDKNFKNGTIAIAKKIASQSRGQAFGVAGGGETVEALNLSGMSQCVDFISTGGGAMLSYLAGERMPGID